MSNPKKESFADFKKWADKTNNYQVLESIQRYLKQLKESDHD